MLTHREDFDIQQCRKRRNGSRNLSKAWLFALAAASLLAPPPAAAQPPGSAALPISAMAAAPPPGKKPPERELIFEGEGSFGNYKIFAQGEDSKLFTSGIEYDRHSWGRFLGAKVYYVAEFLPFVLLDEPADLNYYGVYFGTNKRLVPGIGISPIGFRMSWRDDKAIKPFLMAKGGILLFRQKAESPNASYENISLQSDIGMQVKMSRRLDLRMGVGDFHFSNDFVVPANPGLDVMSYTGGIVVHLKR